jgi:hypothetical protein
MKTLKNSMKWLALLVFGLAIGQQAYAQFGDVQYYRPWDKRGVNQFENVKGTDIDGDFKVRVGGDFTQQFQMLTHENMDGEGIDGGLYDLGPGFNLATANLNLDVQLGDGIRLALENYMSSRHHSEFWVKGGYIQVDKLPMFGNPQWWTDYVTAKIGHFEVNYGDQHFRRTDNGNAMWNPFVGNYIMDAFATEIGGEVYVKLPSGFMAMVGLTAGLINGDVTNVEDADVKKNPSVLLKLAYDKQMNDDLRVRLSGSMYYNGNTKRNTLYSGDRTGSRYYLVMEADGASAGSNFTSGRFNPNLRNKITAIQINPFVKFKGLEFFGTYEMASGGTYVTATEEFEDRTATQIAAELIYRFGANENVYVGGRYNMISGELFTGSTEEASIDRIQVAAGWFVTQNLLLKLEYVSQNYTDFTGLLDEGKFGGIMIEAVAGF